VKQEWLTKIEGMLKQKEVSISLLNAQAEELLEKAKELYTTGEAHANANIKMQEDLNRQAIAIAQWEQLVVERE
jgi:hypothetical protein